MAVHIILIVIAILFYTRIRAMNYLIKQMEDLTARLQELDQFL